MRIKHNIPAKNTYRNLSNTSRSLSKSLEKLSSGYRINRSADDAAGLAISEKMRAQISGLDQAQDNASHGIGLLNVMDGALQEYHNILQRMNVLATQSCNGTLDDEVDRAALQSEYKNLSDELTRIANSTKYNNIGCFAPTPNEPATSFVPPMDIVFVLDRTGSMGTKIQSVADNLEQFIAALGGSDVRIGLVDYADGKANGAPDIESHAFSKNYDQVEKTLNDMTKTSGGTEDGLDALEVALNLGFRSDVPRHIIILGDEKITLDKGSTDTARTAAKEADLKNKLQATNTTLTVIGNTALHGQLNAAGMTGNYFINIGTNFSTELVNFASTIASNASGGYPTELVNLPSLTLQIGDTADQTMTIPRFHMLPGRYKLHDTSVDSIENARTAMAKLVNAINGVSDYRGELGAATNRLEHTINALGVTIENLTDAESTIRDTDMAEEYAKYVKSNILIQSGQAMLAQANQVPQNVLTLMR